MNELKVVELGSVCEVVRGGSPRPIIDYITNEPGGVNWLKIGDVSETDKYFLHANEKIKTSGISKTREVRVGDLILSNSMSFGRAFITKIDGYIHDGWLRLRPDESRLNKEYLYYFLTSSFAQNQFKAVATGSVVNNLKSETVRAAKILLPPSYVQEKIANVLSLIDDKIVINTRINNNLEQQAVLLFRSWFSSFEQSHNVPFKESEFGKIPKDFSVVKVGNLQMLVTDYVANGSFASLKENVTLYQEPNYAYFVRNTDLKSGSFGVFVDQHSYEFLTKSTLYGGEIIISNVGDVGSVFLCPKLDRPMTLGNNIIMLRPEDDSLRYYLYIWFKHLQGQAIIQGIKGGSAQPKFNKTDFKNTSVLLPPTELLSRFHNTVAPMFETINQNQSENKYLLNLRDALLPKLMSGELDVSDIDV